MRNILVNFKNMLTKYKQPIFKSLVFIGYLVALIFLFTLIINISIVAQTKDRIYSVEELDLIDEKYDCILILGAGIRADGSASPMLRDRLLAGIEAHKHIESIPIFLSGDSENSDYCETVTMKSFLLDNDIDEDIIISDGYGLSTYESIWRAKHVYGYNRILIISQKYHLHRAMYIANELGIIADGVDGALTTYGKQPIYNLREYLARIKDMLYSEMNINPKYIEKWEENYE